jgi:hypothetical protein
MPNRYRLREGGNGVPSVQIHETNALLFWFENENGSSGDSRWTRCGFVAHYQRISGSATADGFVAQQRNNRHS